MWATYCGPCRLSLPNLEKVYQEFKGNDKVVFLAVSNDDAQTSDAKIKACLDELGVHVPAGRDSGDYARSAFDITAIPTLILIGLDGKVEMFERGYRAGLAEELPQQLESLLSGKSLAAVEIEAHEKAQRAYDRRLKEALVGLTQEVEIPQAKVLPRSEPISFKLTKLWSIEDIKTPGNVLAVAGASPTSPGAPGSPYSSAPGSPTTEPAANEPSGAEQSSTEPAKADPAKTDSAAAEPGVTGAASPDSPDLGSPAETTSAAASPVGSSTDASPEPAFFVIEAGKAVVQLDRQGQIVARHALELPENAVASYLRQLSTAAANVTLRRSPALSSKCSCSMLIGNC